MLKYYLLIGVIVFIMFLYNSIQFRKNERKKLLELIKNNWGSFNKREYSYDELKKIAYNYSKLSGSKFYIDDISWNDLDMDSVYKLINNTYSSLGEEYLYRILRIPEFNKEILDEREELIEKFYNNEDEVVKLQEIFAKLGRTKNISLSEFMDKLIDIKRKSNVLHYFCILLFFVSATLLFVQPVIGIFAFMGVLIFNIGMYSKKKRDVDNFFICFKYLIDLIVCTENIVNNKSELLLKYNNELEKILKELKGIKKRSFLISMNGNNGSLGEIVMEYIRMIFHVDIIKFNNMTDMVIRNKSNVNELYEILGKIEALMAVASFRKALDYYCVPEFTDTLSLTTLEIFHPMISKPVANDLCEERSVLLTGSNASGKSTFLKTIAINAILAQTINTCTAKKYITGFYKVYTSMSLRDDLFKNDSYFMVEIKSLKRIIDAMDEDIPVLCFVDEVLRGTNTIERISASSYILKYISERNALCFAATHDIELTNILEEIYSNYHFTEKVVEDDVIFNYKLNKGKATSKNAIKLLNIIGFDKEIVDNAKNMADNFIRNGEWIINN